MTIEEAVALLRAMYDKSLTIPHIFNPVAQRTKKRLHEDRREEENA